MEVQIATTTQFHFRHACCAQTFASAISLFEQRGRSPSCSSSASCSRRRHGGESAGLACRGLGRSSLFGTPASLSRSRSCDKPRSGSKPLRRACSAGLESFSEEEFMKNLQELALNFQLSEDGAGGAEAESISSGSGVSDAEEAPTSSLNPSYNSKIDASVAPPWMEFRPLNWPQREEIVVRASIERKASSIEMPMSLRMLKKKKSQRHQGGAGKESGYCSVKKAFSSMVFMIRELQSYTLHIRQLLFYEDLRGVLVNVQREVHASFVWLFQQVFSCTPTLMVYVMILLANFTVYSMGHNTALAAPAPPPVVASTIVSVAAPASENKTPKFDIMSFSSSSGKTLTVGGGSGGGTRKSPPVAGGTEGGDGRLERELLFDASTLSSTGGNSTTTSGRGAATKEDEWSVWGSFVEEAARMQAEYRGEALDHETVRELVSPVVADIEPDDPTTYFRTQLVYQKAIEENPDNPLLLSNYAQFLYVVVHDHDRAEEYFQRAVRAQPPDAEALSRYANFLWLARKDITAAEETFLEAIAADPGNTFYAGNYAHFLWNTGGEDTCYPLDEA
ncbi:hypothetical protein EJ110_NYTH00202 [Nymphaea thermarum]|nr:hypothetical protein EJ110_NYTH00202 [Nymphaea thermarum]